MLSFVAGLLVPVSTRREVVNLKQTTEVSGTSSSVVINSTRPVTTYRYDVWGFTYISRTTGDHQRDSYFQHILNVDGLVLVWKQHRICIHIYVKLIENFLFVR